MALAAVLASALVAGPRLAIASPRANPTTGRAVFTGAASAHPTTLYLNPAVLGLETTARLYLASTLVIDHEQIDRRVEGLDGSLSEGSSLNDVRASPGGELSVSWRPADRIAIGVGLQSAPAERFFSAPGAELHVISGRQRDYSATVGATFRVTSRFFVGTALSLSPALLPEWIADRTGLRSSFEVSFGRDAAASGGSAAVAATCGDAPCGLGNPLAMERYDIDVELGTPLTSLALGILVRLGDETYVGLAYRTPPGFSVQTELSGTSVFTPAAVTGREQARGDATVDISYPASVEAGLTTPLPRDLTLVAGVRWEDTSRLSVYDVRLHGRDLEAAGVPEWLRRARAMRDAVALWTGVEQGEREGWRLGGRLGFELGSVATERISPGNSFTSSLTFDGGAQWRGRGASWAVQLSWGLAYFLPVSVTDSAFSALNQVQCVDSGYDYASEACRAARSGYGIDTAAGDYRRVQHALRLGLRYDF